MFRKIQDRLGGKDVLSFYQQIPTQNFNFAYINCNKNYIINQVDHLFRGQIATMFSNQTIFVIHPKGRLCGPKDKKNSVVNSLHEHVNDFIKTNYPKQKHLSMVFDILEPYNLIGKNLFFTSFPNIHLADIVSFFNNKFGKLATTDPRFLKICKFFRTQNIKFPKIAIKNPVAQKYVCA